MHLLRTIARILDALDDTFFSCPWCGRRWRRVEYCRNRDRPIPIPPPNWHARGPFFQPAIDRAAEAQRDQIAHRLRQSTVVGGDPLAPWRETVEQATEDL